MKYQVVVGIEMHCEMSSNTKVFSKGSNTYSKKANTNVNEIDLAFPGILPNINFKCVEKALKAALILNCKIPEYLMFDRKNYYYPDLPKGYQITQNTYPIGTNGNINIKVDGEIKNVEILDIHLEEDTASLDHLDTFSLIDYNRAGVPLLECVTGPCLYSAKDAVTFIDTMCKIYQYTGISEADTRKGQIRCDVNVNLKDENGNFVTPKVEIKNVNSLGGVRDTIIYEEKRQLEALEKGETLYQETRRWDEEKGITVHMRSKEDAIDYKYFIEPNIPPYKIDEDFINEVKETIPRLALEREEEYINTYGIEEVNAKALVREKDIADYFEKCINTGIDAKIASNWVLGLIISYLNKNEININDFYLTPELLIEIIDAEKEGKISSKQAKEIFIKSLEEKKSPKEFISSDNMQINDESLLDYTITKILALYPKQIEEYKNGKTNMFDFFVGMVMKETKGKANPSIVKDILNNKLK